MRVDTAGGAGDDDLDTISGTDLVAGDIVILRCAHPNRDVTIRDVTTGNIRCQTSIVLDDTSKTAMLIFDGTNWLRVASV